MNCTHSQGCPCEDCAYRSKTGAAGAGAPRVGLVPVLDGFSILEMAKRRAEQLRGELAGYDVKRGELALLERMIQGADGQVKR